jgi:hypothetical protein
MSYARKDGTPGRIEVMSRDAHDTKFRGPAGIDSLPNAKFEELYEEAPPPPPPPAADALPRWRKRSEPATVVELFRRDAVDVNYRHGGALHSMPVEEFDRTFEPVLPTVRLPAPAQQMSSPSRAAADGSIIPATPSAQPAVANTAMMTAIGSLLDELRAQRDDVRGIRDVLAQVIGQLAEIHAAINTPAPPAAGTPPAAT